MKYQTEAGPDFAGVLTDLKAQLQKAKTPEKIWLAGSGGLDSSVLLFLLDALQRVEKSFELGVLHVNFSLRGEESDRDESFIRQQAAAYGREIRVLKVDPNRHPPLKSGIQEWARELRYAWFSEQKGPQDWIAVAHHKDDAIETLFARLCRGHSLLALPGMQGMHKQIWRPLLQWTREDLKKLSIRHELSFCEDRSNSSLDYTRNRLRLKILPELEEIFPGMGQNLWQHTQDLQDALHFIQNQVASLPDSDTLNFGLLQSRPPFLARQEIANFVLKRDPSFKPRRDVLVDIYQALAAGLCWEQLLSPGTKVQCQQGILSVQTVKSPESARWQQYRDALLDETPEQWPESKGACGKK